MNEKQLLDLFSKISNTPVRDLVLSIYDGKGNTFSIGSMLGQIKGNDYKVNIGDKSCDLVFEKYVDDLDPDIEMKYIYRVIESALGLEFSDGGYMLVVYCPDEIVYMNKSLKVAFVNNNWIGSIVFADNNRLVKIIGAGIDTKSGLVKTMAVAYDIWGSSESLPYPPWLKQIITPISLYKNPINMEYWNTINYKESDSSYDGQKLFIIPDIGAMISLEGQWIEVDLLGLNKFGVLMQGKIGEEIRLYKGISET